MKTTIIAVLSLLLLLPTLSLAEGGDIPQIAVTGSSTAMVAPDQMNWSVNVTNKGLELKEVAARHTQIVNAVLALIEKRGVKKEAIQTARMQFGEDWGYRNNSRFKEGYFASSDISFKLADFDSYGPLWMGLAQMQDVSVGGVHFTLRDPATYQDAERAKALRSAKQKAESMAQVLGAKVGEPLLMADESSSFPEPMMAKGRVMMATSDAGAPEAQLAPGQIPVQVQVRVVFRLLYP